MAFYMRSPVFTPNDPVKSVRQLHSWVYQLNENLRFMFSNLDSDNFSSEFAANFSLEAINAIRSALNRLEESVQALSQANEWEKIELTGMTMISGETAPCALLEGNAVFISGSACLNEAMLSGETRVIASLSEKYRPRRAQAMAAVCAQGLTEIGVHPSGEVTLTNFTGAALPAGMYAALSVSYGI